MGKEVDIGDKRSIIMSVLDNGIRLVNKQTKPGKSIADNTVTLDAGAYKILCNFFDDLGLAVIRCKDGELKEDFFLPLGGRLFAQVKTDVKCVSIRKFFRTKHNPELLLPGFPGVSLTFKEFDNFDKELAELVEYDNFENVPFCYFKNPKEHKDCKYCFY